MVTMVHRGITLVVFSLMVYVMLIPNVVSVNEDIQIISVIFEELQPAHDDAYVFTTLSHNEDAIPVLTLYYIYILEGGIQSGDWKIAETQLKYVTESGYSVFASIIPNKVYRESLPFNVSVIFFLEVKDRLGNIFLSCSESQKWDPFNLDGKYQFRTVDIIPPSFESVELYPSQPNLEETVRITVTIAEEHSGIEEMNIRYMIGNIERTASMKMENEYEGKYIFSVEVPPPPFETVIDYIVIARDNAGNEAAYTSEFQVTQVWKETMIMPTIPKLILIIIIVALASFLGFFLIKGIHKVKGLTCKHPRYMTVIMIIVFLIGISVFTQFAQNRSYLPGLIFLVFCFGSWGFIDPRVDIFIPFKPRINDNPALAFLVEAYLLGGFSVLVIAGFILFKIYSISMILDYSTMLAAHIAILTLLGIVLQLSWRYLKNLDISVEVERSIAGA